MNVVKEIERINRAEINLGLSEEASWHYKYRDSPYVYVGGLPFELTEGDVMCVFSQYGEIVDINLVRDESTGQSKGFCFLAYHDWRSTVLAVDNFSGAKLLGRTLRVDHVRDYKKPEEIELEKKLKDAIRGRTGDRKRSADEEQHERAQDEAEEARDAKRSRGDQESSSARYRSSDTTRREDDMHSMQRSEYAERSGAHGSLSERRDRRGESRGRSPPRSRRDRSRSRDRSARHRREDAYRSRSDYRRRDDRDDRRRRSRSPSPHRRRERSRERAQKRHGGAHRRRSSERSTSPTAQSRNNVETTGYDSGEFSA